MKRNMVRWATATVVAVTAAATVGTSTAGATTAPGLRVMGATAWDPQHVDFNGDSKPDLAIGVPDCSIGTSVAGVGCVAVVYGGTKGVDPAKHTNLSESYPGVPGSSEPGDTFGASLVPVDLDGDGYTDLVVGSPGEQVSLPAGGSGGLTVMWGGPKGLTSGSFAYFGINTDSFALGRFVGAGDFDGDGKADLVFEGPDFSLRIVGDFDRNNPPEMPGQPVGKETVVPITDNVPAPRIENIAVGDVNGDGVSDLVAVVRNAGDRDSHRPILFTGGPHGLTQRGTVTDVKGNALVGQSAAIGDVNGDGYGDIVIGHGSDDLPTGAKADLPTKGGAVGVAYGGPAGQSTTLKPVWINQATPGVHGVAEAKDHMGAAVSVADVNGDGYADVIAGVPGEDFSGLTNAGSVLVLKGGSHGLSGAGAQSFTQNTEAVPGVAEKNDAFGATVGVIGPLGSTHAQVVVGDPAENKAGAVWVLPTSVTGPKAAGSIAFGPGDVREVFAPQASFGDVLNGGAPIVPQG